MTFSAQLYIIALFKYDTLMKKQISFIAGDNSAK